MFDVIVLDVAANSYEEITRHGVIFLQSLENFHFLRKSGRLDLLLANKVCQRAACHREGNDADDHHHHAEHLFEGGAGRHVTVPNGRDRRDGEVDRRHVYFATRALLIAGYPRVFGVRVNARTDNPAAADDVSRHNEVAHERRNPFVVGAYIGQVHQPTLEAERVGLLDAQQPHQLEQLKNLRDAAET